MRERIAIAVADANGCEYCLYAHTYIGGNIAKVDEAELEKAREADSRNAHTRAILWLADAVVRGRDEVFQEVRAAGVAEREIAETVGHVALNVLTNLFNKLARVDTDWPAVTPRRSAA